MKEVVYPTSLMKGMKKQEEAITSKVNDIMEEASSNLANRLAIQHNISLKKAFKLVDLPEYENMLQEEALRVKELYKRRK